MVEDPWLFVWHLHLLLTFTHFITWLSSYGGGVTGYAGPSEGIAVFDDVIVSLMGLTGWLAVIYFFRYEREGFGGVGVGCGRVVCCWCKTQCRERRPLSPP